MITAETLDWHDLYARAARRLAWRAARLGAEDAEAIAHDALLRLWRALARGQAFPNDAALYAYLSRALAHAVIDWRRYRARPAVVLHDDTPAPPPSGDGDVAELLAAIRALPDAQARALLLTAAGYAPGELARALPAVYPTPDAVYDALRFGRATLRRRGWGVGRRNPHRRHA